VSAYVGLPQNLKDLKRGFTAGPVHRKLTRTGRVGAICIFVVQIRVGDLHRQAVVCKRKCPGEGILSAGDLKTERLQFQTVRRLTPEEMAPPTAWGSG
jgi:hypothetical protein